MKKIMFYIILQVLLATQINMCVHGSDGYNGTLIITMDDGGVELYSIAVPILERQGYTGKATFAIITSFVGRKENMNWTQIADLHVKGYEIASHTVTHACLTCLSQAQLKEELNESGHILQQVTGYFPYTIIYPGTCAKGVDPCNDTVFQYCKKYGYALGRTGWNTGSWNSSTAKFWTTDYLLRHFSFFEVPMNCDVGGNDTYTNVKSILSDLKNRGSKYYTCISFHGFCVGNAPNSMVTPANNFTAILEYCAAHNIRVESLCGAFKSYVELERDILSEGLLLNFLGLTIVFVAIYVLTWRHLKGLNKNGFSSC